MTSPARPDRPLATSGLPGVGPVRVLDVSFRGRSWQLHDVGRATWLVYPWGSTDRLWGRMHAVEWAGREGRWESINRAGEVRWFGSFGDAAMFACLLPDRSIHVTDPGPAGQATARLTHAPVHRSPLSDGPGR